jgi:glucan phosphoethanolaminetransferase (alkaline phosphatase superfamily)
MENAQKTSNVQNGLVFGVIIGLVYCISLFLRYNQTSSGPIMIGLIAICFYLIVIAFLFFCGLKRRKELGGFIVLKDAFQTIFVAILVAELIYTIFNIIYLKFIDPNYFDKLYTAMESFIEKSIKDDTQREQAMDKLKSQLETQKSTVTPKGIFLGYLISVAITGIFGFIAALIIKKQKPVFDVEPR